MNEKYLLVLKTDQARLVCDIAFNTKDMAQKFLDDGLISLPKDVEKGDVGVKPITLIR